jgi:hypothetical protein
MAEISKAEGFYKPYADQDDLIQKTRDLELDDVTKLAISLGIPHIDVNNKNQYEIIKMVEKEIISKKTQTEIEEVRRKLNNLDEADINKFKLEQDLPK